MGCKYSASWCCQVSVMIFFLIILLHLSFITLIVLSPVLKIESYDHRKCLWINIFLKLLAGSRSSPALLTDVSLACSSYSSLIRFICTLFCITHFYLQLVASIAFYLGLYSSYFFQGCALFFVLSLRKARFPITLQCFLNFIFKTVKISLSDINQKVLISFSVLFDIEASRGAFNVFELPVERCFASVDAEAAPEGKEFMERVELKVLWKKSALKES